MVQRCGSTSVSDLFGWQPTSCLRTTQDDPFIGAAFRPAALTALDKLQTGHRAPAPAHSSNETSQQTGYRVPAPAHSNNAPSQQTGYRVQAPVHRGSSAQSQQTVASLILSAALRSNDHQLPTTPGPHINDTPDNAKTITPSQTGIILLCMAGVLNIPCMNQRDYVSSDHPCSRFSPKLLHLLYMS